MNGDRFSLAEAGRLNELLNTSKDPVPGKLFLKEKLGMTGMEVSLNQLPEGGALPFYHSHRENEELYLFISGRGQLQADGRIIDVKEGTAVRFSPECVRTLRNNGSGDLIFVVVQVQAGSLRQWVLEDADILDKPVIWPE